jgi:hypothetical protein
MSNSNIGVREFILWRLRVHQRVQKKKTLGKIVYQVKYESYVDLMVYVMEGFDLPITDEGGLLYKLKAIGLKVGK